MNSNCKHLGEADAPTPCQFRPLSTQSRDMQFENTSLCLCFILFLQQLNDLQNHNSFAVSLFLGEVACINHWRTTCKDFLPCRQLLGVQVAARAGTSQAAAGASKSFRDHDKHHLGGTKPSDEVKQQTMIGA